MNAPLSQHGGLSTVTTPRSIGDILVANGRLSADDLQRILARQKQDKVNFGDAAMALKVLTQDDIDFALSKQFDYSYLSPSDSSLSPALVAAYKPISRVGENLRAVRSQLMLRWFNGDPMHKILAVVSAASGDGKTFIAANLAIVFAQQGERTLLIDGDLRTQPDTGQQALFKLGRNAGLSGILASRAGMEVAQQVPGLPSLSVITAGAVPPNPQELLGRPAFGQLLMAASVEFDVVLIDTPNGGDYADSEVIAARAGAAVLVTRVNQSVIPQAAKLAKRLQDNGVSLVGSVFNDA
jgi:receptor protein-tyrosine kinase